MMYEDYDRYGFPGGNAIDRANRLSGKSRDRYSSTFRTRLKVA